MQLVGIARHDRRLLAHERHRRGVEPRQIARGDRQAAAQTHRARAALLERRVVEEGIRLAVQDLVRERRRLARVAQMQLDLAALDSKRDRERAVGVERLVQAVVHRLAHDRVVGQLDRTAGLVLLALRQAGEDRGHQIVGLHALDRRRVAPPAAEAQHGERATEVPAPARGEHRREQHRLRERLAQLVRAQERRGHLEREAVLRAEREHERVVAGRGLELEVERAADPLARDEPERAVDPAAERRVHDELHPAALVEETLDHDPPLARQRAERGVRRVEIGHDLRSARGVEPGARRERGARHGRSARHELARDLVAQRRQLARELRAARRRLAEPERHGRRSAVRVAHAHHAGLDAADLPRRGAEQEHVAGHALDRPVFVHRADDRVVGIGDDAIVGGLGNRAARGDRGEPRAAPAA